MALAGMGISTPATSREHPRPLHNQATRPEDRRRLNQSTGAGPHDAEATSLLLRWLHFGCRMRSRRQPLTSTCSKFHCHTRQRRYIISLRRGRQTG